MKETKYFVNPEKKTVVCIITVQDEYFREIHRFEGKAKCSPEDTFNEEIGKEIARNRAFIKMKAYLRDYKKEVRKAIATHLIALTKLNMKFLDGINRNEAEIKTAKARIRELGTSK